MGKIAHAYTPGAPDLAACGYAPRVPRPENAPESSEPRCTDCVAVLLGSRPWARTARR